MPEVFGEIGFEVTQVYRPADVDVDRYDALLVPGGGDVDPVFWGGQKHPAASELDPEKDRFQIEAIQAFAKAGKPILGVCRGEQLINVAFGGSMIQNLYPNSREPVYEEGFHKVRTAKGSWVRKVYGETPRVFFHHHQAVDRLGEGIIATAWSTDHPYPHIEAIQHERLPIYGVQWHPDAEVESQGIEIYRAFRQVSLDNMAR
jgi:putative glutamine amidotransferase